VPNDEQEAVAWTQDQLITYVPVSISLLAPLLMAAGAHPCRPKEPAPKTHVARETSRQKGKVSTDAQRQRAARERGQIAGHLRLVRPDEMA